MSQKQVNRYKRMIRRQRDRIIKNFMESIKDYNFFDRVAIAWEIISKRRAS
jgi:hypothetical protein